MTETKLKPCPFCGEETKLRIDDIGLNKRYYSCRVCLAYGPAGVGEDGAIKAWNTRKMYDNIVKQGPFLDDCETPDPGLDEILYSYYREYFGKEDAQRLADQYLEKSGLGKLVKD